MLTKNFYNVLAAMLSRRKGEAKAVTLTDCTGLEIIRNVFGDGSLPHCLLGSICSMQTQNHGIWQATYLGTGKTPATVNDYIMEEPISDGRLTVVTPLDGGLVILVNNTCTEVSATHVVTNNTSQPIEITEVGLYGGIENVDTPILFDHTILDDPIILAPGETAPVNYAIKFPYGT